MVRFRSERLTGLGGIGDGGIRLQPSLFTEVVGSAGGCLYE